MRSAALVIALGAASVTACAAIGVARGPDPDEVLHAGIQALRAQQYDRAVALLEPVYLEHWQEPVGRRAMLALTAAELDSRNPDRSLWRAADISARLLNVPDLDPWLVPVTEAYYLLALELGAAQERLAQADSITASAARDSASTASSGRTLPQSEREPVPVQLNRIVSQRDALRKQVEGLQEQLATRDRELRETKQELERIKKTIKP